MHKARNPKAPGKFEESSGLPTVVHYERYIQDCQETGDLIYYRYDENLCLKGHATYKIPGSAAMGLAGLLIRQIRRLLLVSIYWQLYVYSFCHSKCFSYLHESLS